MPRILQGRHSLARQLRLAGSDPRLRLSASPEPGDRYRLFLTANGFATHVKLAGTVTPDPNTGQLTISFPNLPQSPVHRIQHALLRLRTRPARDPDPVRDLPGQSTFTPWDAALARTDLDPVLHARLGPGGAPCPGPHPSLQPELPGRRRSNHTAAAHTPFSLELTRPDGDQNLSALNVTTPPGFSATLKGIPYCSDAALAAAAEPSYSGSQRRPTQAVPRPARSAPPRPAPAPAPTPSTSPARSTSPAPTRAPRSSLAVITPAVSGPYDLGNVVVRAALHVNPETAQITAVSDPLPQILEGIPLRLRSIRVNLNRPNFTLNPTNCDPFSVTREIFGTEGAVAKPSAHFQVANCAHPPLRPQAHHRDLRLHQAHRQPGAQRRTDLPPGWR